MATWTWFHRLASPPHVYAFARRWTPWFGGFAAAAILIALYGGLDGAPYGLDAARLVAVARVGG